MSSVVGLVDDGIVYIGCDSGFYGEDGSTEIRKDSKVFKRGSVIYGVSGSPRVLQLIQYVMPMQRRRMGQDAFDFMVSNMANAIRNCLIENCSNVFTDVMPDGSCVLVGFDGRLFKIEENFAVCEQEDCFDAIGSGGEYARSALIQQELTIKAMRRSKREYAPSAKQRILDALTVGEKASNCVRRPFVIVST